tara:strand:- start:78 stop:587 length:510 start_codon:yes stop_codon:yes gene_type:complete
MARNNHMNNKFVAVAEFDISEMSAWTGSVLPVGSYSATNGKCVLPDGALLIKAYYYVDETFSDDDATEDAEISLGYTGALDAIVDDIDIQTSDATGVDIWDAGAHGTKIGYASAADASQDTNIEDAALRSASFVKLTADSEVLMTVTDDQLDAGSLTLYIEYVLTGVLA